MQKKQDGKILQLKSDEEKPAIKLERMQNDWVRSQRETIRNLITSGFIELVISPKYQPEWYRRMLTVYVNLQGINMYCRDGVWFGPLTQSDIEWNKMAERINKQETTMWYEDAYVTAQSKNYFLRELQNIAVKKQEEATKRFGIESPKPKNMAEAGEWLRAGKFRLGHDRTEASLSDVEFYAIYQISDWLTWVDPTIVRDEDGYNQYMTRLSTETKRIERLIVACRLDSEGYDYSRDDSSDYNVIIDAIEKLEAWDWTPPVKVIPLPIVDSGTEVALAA